MAQTLNVYLGDNAVGVLSLDSRRQFSFQYVQSWLDNKEAMPLSLRLPLQADAFDDDRTRIFFTNLLPESGLRSAIARKLGISEQNDFALLEAIGGECAGAVSLLTDDMTPVTESEYKSLDDAELNALIRDMPERPMLAGESGIRLSLAGAQNKMPVWFDGNRTKIPIKGSPSSHILKPPIAGINHTVENEAFCMELASRQGLPVPLVQILQKEIPLYLVKRYDRKEVASGELQRVHQEDFCQALGFLPEAKYQAEGGPGLADCFEIVRKNSIRPASDISALLNWTIFNALIGNADAHAKNISFLLTENGPELAPFYDLICTAVYPQLAERMAMKIGGENRPNWIIKRKWQAFAVEVGISFRLVQSRLKSASADLPGQAVIVLREYQEVYGDNEIYEEIINVINTNCDKVQRIFS